MSLNDLIKSKMEELAKNTTDKKDKDLGILLEKTIICSKCGEKNSRLAVSGHEGYYLADIICLSCGYYVKHVENKVIPTSLGRCIINVIMKC